MQESHYQYQVTWTNGSTHGARQSVIPNYPADLCKHGVGIRYSAQDQGADHGIDAAVRAATQTRIDVEMMTSEKTISHACHIQASPAAVWKHITEVDIAAFPHAWWLTVLGIPRPLRAEIIASDVGGVRLAHFAGGQRFSQKIIAWDPLKTYAFTFHADAGFRVAHVLDLSSGPLQMVSGRYTLQSQESGVWLELHSRYALHGCRGQLLRLPVFLTLHAFQRYLLRGIQSNAEGEHA